MCINSYRSPSEWLAKILACFRWYLDSIKMVFFLYSINLTFFLLWIKLNVIHFSDRKNPFIWIHCNKTMVEAHLYSNSIVPYFFRWFLFHHEDDHVIYVLNHLQFIFRQYNSIYLGITLGQKLNVEKLACKEAKKKTEAKKMNKIKYELQ